MNLEEIPKKIEQHDILFKGLMQRIISIEKTPRFKLAYSVKEASHELGLALITVRDLIKEGKLKIKPVMPGEKKQLIYGTSLAEYLQIPFEVNI